MRLTVVLDHKFYRFKDGRIGSLTTFGPSFWDRYLSVFEKLRIVCRVRPESFEGAGVVPIESEKIEFFPVPYYEGVAGFLKQWSKIRRDFSKSFSGRDAYILRAPQLLPNVAYRVLRDKKIPFGVEVVGDPWDLYAPGAEGHFLRPVIRRYAYKKLIDICRNACASSYVTHCSLQKRYPPRSGTFSTFASSVEIARVADSSRSYTCRQNSRPFTILFVGTLNRLYKGQDTLIEACAICVHRFGLNLQVRLVGDGREAANLKNLCEKLDIGDKVLFLGALPRGEAVFQEMERADLFVLPSRQEGLPRSVIEAMSVGLPCIATNVGGIPELIESSYTVPPNSPQDLAEKIAGCLSDPGKLSEMSAINLRRSREYTVTEIQPRREAFYRHLRDAVRGEVR